MVVTSEKEPLKPLENAIDCPPDTSDTSVEIELRQSMVIINYVLEQRLYSCNSCRALRGGENCDGCVVLLFRFDIFGVVEQSGSQWHRHFSARALFHCV